MIDYFYSMHITTMVNLWSSYFYSYCSFIFYSIDLRKSFPLTCYLYSSFVFPKAHWNSHQLFHRNCCYIINQVNLRLYQLDLKEINSYGISSFELLQSMNLPEDLSLMFRYFIISFQYGFVDLKKIVSVKMSFQNYLLQILN